VSTRALAQAAGIQGGSLYHPLLLQGRRSCTASCSTARARFFRRPASRNLEEAGASYPRNGFDRFRPGLTSPTPNPAATPSPSSSATWPTSPRLTSWKLQAVRRQFPGSGVQRFLAEGMAAPPFSRPRRQSWPALIAILDLLKGGRPPGCGEAGPARPPPGGRHLQRPDPPAHGGAPPR